MTATHPETERALVSASGLVKKFGDFTAVGGIDVEVRRGEAFGFLGPNGAGKSSTMRMVACVSPRTSGELSVLGMDPDLQGPQIRARIGVVPQGDILDTELTVRQNLQVYGRYFGFSRAHVQAKATELLEFAQLTEKADAEVEALSGGMKRRLTIARSLVNDPELLLLDEPTTGLDPQARHLLWERLFRLKQRGATLIITTHYMDEAQQLCDRLVVMDAGKIVAEGTPTDLISRYATREVLELRFPQADPATVSSPTPWRGPTPSAISENPQTSDNPPTEALIDLADRIEVLPDRLLLYTADGEAALAAAHNRGVRPSSSLVRRSTLEDVFLRLTGRSLVD
jgi:lipooligosaccharide transport system ATP-binding protein